MSGPNPSGLCMCGCGQPAPIARQSDTARNWVKGQPKKFVNGHNEKTQFIDLTRQRFDKLVVESRAENTKQGSAAWDCLCDCGNRALRPGGTLTRRTKGTKSCGRCPNRTESFGDAIVIWLTYKNYEVPCFIDAADYLLVKDYRWHASKAGKTFYARSSGDARCRKKCVMHAIIFGERDPDHKDRDGLNNRRNNLRAATPSQSKCNRVLPNKTTGLRGVSLLKGGRFAAYCNRICFGTFDTAIEAARAYNKAAKELHGEFAVLNELPEDDLVLNQKPKGTR